MLLLFLISPVLGALVSEPQPPSPRSSVVPTLSWLPVRLNHFDASNNDTFLMRYYYNNEFATSNNVVIVVGGPWSIAPDWVTGGLPHELAEKIGAGLFYTEHRYYGQTRPTSDTSVPELRFLSTDQALGDLAQFIQHVKSDQFEGGRFSGGQVALAGCALAGSLATWMRLAYPHLVSAAFSDSGPLLAQDEFAEYLEVVWEALRVQGGAECVATLDEAMERLFADMLTQEGPDRISRMFNTCTPINGSDPLDTTTFFWWGVLQPLARLVQSARPGDIAGVCDVLTDTSVPPLQAVVTERLASWVTSQAAGCLQASYTALLAEHTNTSYDAPRSADRLWMYQSCVQFGWHHTTASFYSFHNAVALPYFRNLCRQYFSDDFDDTLQWEGIERTNLLFGGLSVLPDRVLSVAARHDPNSLLTPNTTHATQLSPVYVLQEGSQCQVISSSEESAPPHVRAVRRAALLNMQELVAGRPPSHVAGAPPLAPVILIVLLASLALVL
ncbi:PREDICTED: putative serine protease K12H4.7 [Papilio polytes]|uniref:putative serine protease K12H4.7 n=1 Tax=Papilio polytes TaxID=76194 RepID=UPI000675BCC1|nr:PREDICTED: putative serine protease K12H4.7 [Papilio polytes]